LTRFRRGVIFSGVADTRRLAAIHDARYAGDARVVVTISDFGPTGSFSDVPASELTSQAEAGIVAINPHGSRPPVMVGVPLSEQSCGTVAAGRRRSVRCS
jgi:hypothetical protein